MNYILFDDSKRDNLLPLVYTRPVADIRIGILTIREKWEHYLGIKTSSLTEDYLARKYPLQKEENNVLINGSVLPNPKLIERITSLKPNQALVCTDSIVAIHLTSEEIDKVEEAEYEEIPNDDCHICIQNLWDIFSRNNEALRSDFNLLTNGRTSAPVDKSNVVFGKENIFIEEGAKIKGASLNGLTGPIYIGRDTEIMEGALIRGPFALCDHAIVKMGAKIYGPTTIGPHSKVGGEINNSILFGYSNKAHDGFLGHSVIGEWCNLGANTCNSNLKNNYDLVKIWNYSEQSFVDTGLQFCGLFMGDHSMTAINTMFNTGTVVGVCTNIFGSGFQRNFVASFQKGGPAGFKHYDFDKVIDAIRRVFHRRGLELSDTDTDILKNVYEDSFTYRRSY